MTTDTASQRWDDKRAWDSLQVGLVTSESTLEVTHQTAILIAVSTWDLFPGHYSVAYAQEQGQKDVYLSTITLQGFVDRVCTDYLGSTAWVSRRKMAMRHSVYPGDRLVGSATVQEVRRETSGDVIEADFDVVLRVGEVPVVLADVTVRRLTPSGAHDNALADRAGHTSPGGSETTT